MEAQKIQKKAAIIQLLCHHYCITLQFEQEDKQATGVGTPTPRIPSNQINIRGEARGEEAREHTSVPLEIPVEKEIDVVVDF
ncbi:hypothetical protein ACJX0J_039403, partial [Zea mays]